MDQISQGDVGAADLYINLYIAGRGTYDKAVQAGVVGAIFGVQTEIKIR